MAKIPIITIIRSERLLIIVIGLLIIFSFIYFNKEDKTIKINKKIYVNKEIKSNYTIGEARKLSLTNLKQLSDNFVLRNHLKSSFKDKFYNCLGQKIWEKSEEYTINMLDCCYQDYKKYPDHEMPQYFNSAKLLSNFNLEIKDINY